MLGLNRVRQQTKVGFLRFFVALILGPLLSVGCTYLFCRLGPQPCESMFEFVGRILGLGFEGAGLAVLITMTTITVLFAGISWIVLRSWGPLRYRPEPESSSDPS